MPVSGAAPRWHLALLLGAPLVVGLGYWYLRRRANALPTPAAPPSAPVSLDEDARATGSAAAPKDALDLALKYKVRGNKAFHAGDYDEAAALYERAIAACPPNCETELATFYQNRSACHEKRERWDLVIADCTEALRHNDRYVRALMRRARAAEKSGDLVTALEDMTAACILEQFKQRASLLSTDRVLKALGRKHAREAAESRGPVAPSPRFVKAYLESFVRDPTLTATPRGEAFARARLALPSGEWSRVESACTDEVDAGGPDAALALLLRATMRMLAARAEDALADLDAVLERADATDAIRVNALVKRATLRLQSEDAERCAEDFERASTILPDDPDLRFHRGQAFMLAGDLESANREFAEAARVEPNSAIALVRKCFTEYNATKSANRVEDVPRVLAAFADALERFPEFAEAHVLYAEVLSDLESFDEATRAFDRAIQLDPTNANVYVHKAILRLKMTGEVDDAVALINRAIEVDDKCLFAYETLGTIEVQRENLKEAVRLFEKAIALTRTESEMTHMFSLRDAAKAQIKVAERWGIEQIINFSD